LNNVLKMLHLLLLSLCLGTAIARSLNEITTATDIETPNVVVRYAAQPPFSVKIGPKPAFKPMPASSPRDRECIVKGGGSDDSAAILEAIKSCNGGGRVVFSRETKYTVGKALDLTKLKQIDLGK
jgi:galacturan 1,4-alpha-galacturonidase